MWIKVKTLNNGEVFVNADEVKAILPFDTNGAKGTNVYFNLQEAPLQIKTTLSELDTLLDVNSIEKCIDRLKVENMQLAQQIQYGKAFDEIYGARAKKGNKK